MCANFQCDLDPLLGVCFWNNYDIKQLKQGRKRHDEKEYGEQSLNMIYDHETKY